MDGGGELILRQVARLARPHAELDLALLWGDAAAASIDAPFDEVRTLGFPANLRAGTAFAHQRAMRDFQRWIDERRIDALLAFSFPIAVRAAHIAARNALPMAWFWQQSFPLFHSRLAGAKQRASIRLLRRADCHIVSPTREGIDQFAGLRHPARRLHLIRNGVDVGHFAPTATPAADKDTLRSRLGIPDVDLVVACVARLDPVKGHDTLLEATGLAARSGVSVALLCIGADPERGGSYGETLQRRVASLGLEERVIWAGHQADVRPWLQAADAAALISHEECAPLALAEAGAAGLPLIGTRVGGIPEIVRAGETGLLVEPRDAADCAAAFGELARDAALRRRLAAGALAAVRKDFDSATTHEQWSQLIEALLESTR